MFLHELVVLLSHAIRDQLLDVYGAEAMRTGSPVKRWDELMDMRVRIQVGEVTEPTVRAVLDDEIIKPVAQLYASATLGNEHPAGGADEAPSVYPSPPAIRIPGRRAALLFGPPGTSKTSLVRAVADRLGWPYVEITPSSFLDQGFERVFVRANEIFRDLMDLYDVVVFFDEMDALVASRGDVVTADTTENGSTVVESPSGVDLNREFLTTTMLPKLADLHDRAALVFFMATNHQGRLDAAIKRPGRFDLYMCVGPPPLTEKISKLQQFFRVRPQDLGDAEYCRTRLHELAALDADGLLDVLTFGEMKTFLEDLRRTHPTLETALRSEDSNNRFHEILHNYSTFASLAPGKPMRAEYERDQMESRRQ